MLYQSIVACEWAHFFVRQERPAAVERESGEERAESREQRATELGGSRGRRRFAKPLIFARQ
jgi:hypothetical protein